MSLNFNAIDVETANSDRASICQIGIVHVVDGKIGDTWESLINPEDWFDPWNVQIHGISQEMVACSPTLPQVREELRRRLRGSIVVCHTSFDRVAFERAMHKYGLEQLQVKWLDSAKVVRRTWSQFAKLGYGLKNVADAFGIEFKHHDALEDATATAHIFLRAIEHSKINIHQWVEQTASGYRKPREVIRYEKLSGQVDGELQGQTMVFTGALEMTRREATVLAEDAGCIVTNSMSSNVSILVVGTQDKHKLNGMTKSGKHRKAESMLARGHDIQIISERDFLDLIRI